MKDKKIYLEAYFSQNLGDDLFVKIICNRYPKVSFYSNIHTIYYNETLYNDNFFISLLPKKIVDRIIAIYKFINKLIIKNDKLTNLLNRVFNKILRPSSFSKEKFDAHVTIGGSIFMDESDYSSLALDLNDPALKINSDYQLINKDKPCYIIGANIGPAYSEKYLKGLVCEFEKKTDICFRDKASYNLYSFLPNVRYAPDVLFNFDITPFTNTLQKCSVVLSIIDIEIRGASKTDTDNYHNKIVEICRYYISNGFTINLVSFCEREGDAAAIKNVYSRFVEQEKRSINRIYYTGDYNPIFKAIAEAQYIIAGRFHSMIIAMMFNKPFFPICYNDKMHNYLKDLHFPYNKTDIREFHSLSNNFIDYNRNQIPIDIQDQISSAQYQFSELDKFLS